MYKLLELNYNQTKSTPESLFKMCDFWMYSVNFGVLIHQGEWADVDLEENTGNGTHTQCWNLQLISENEIIQPVSIICLNNWSQ